MSDYCALAQLLFPHVTKVPQDYEELYPPRRLAQGARVTRYAPSPTGHMHTGNLFSALVSERCAHSTGGVFYIRIEDTDKKREIEQGVEGILEDLEFFGLSPDEGMLSPNEEQGQYGPYRQSQRRDIYHCYAKYLVEQGLAYPCFCTPEELDAIRSKQEGQQLTPGYYGQWAVYRDSSVEQSRSLMEQGRSYVLRLRSPGSPDGKVVLDDQIKGRIEIPENIQDIVLLKADGIPTYHFAHVVDDHLMRTTHVIRGDEWISSAPIHLQLFRTLGLTPPKYCHISPLMKEDDGGKRKLSKRKDPEAAVRYYIEQGYPRHSVLDYLLTLANSNFEDWRRANPREDRMSFPFNIKKMSQSGALFDLVKLHDVSKNVISLMSAEEVCALSAQWAKAFAPDFYKKLTASEAFSIGIFSIDRYKPKPRKDIGRWNELEDYTAYFFSDEFSLSLPDNIAADDAVAILQSYLPLYDPEDTHEQWFDKIRSLCSAQGFSPDVKEYKRRPQDFKGHVGDVSSVIRIAITGRTNTPDLYSIMRLLGTDCCVGRLGRACEKFGRIQ